MKQVLFIMPFKKKITPIKSPLFRLFSKQSLKRDENNNVQNKNNFPTWMDRHERQAGASNVLEKYHLSLL